MASTSWSVETSSHRNEREPGSTGNTESQPSESPATNRGRDPRFARPLRKPSKSKPLQLINEYRNGAYRLVRGNAQLLNSGVIAVGGIVRRYVFIHPPAAIGFRIPGYQGTLSFGATLHPDVWNKPEVGPCAIIVKAGRQELGRVVVDPSIPGGQQWQDVEIEIPAGLGATRELVFETVGIDGMSYRWMLIGEPTFSRVDVASASVAASAESNGALPPSNQPPSNQGLVTPRRPTRLAPGRSTVSKSNADEASPFVPSVCPAFAKAVIEREAAQLGRPPKVLEFGACAVSSLGELVTSGLADVTSCTTNPGIVTRSEDDPESTFSTFTRGANLLDLYAPESFDVVFAWNAITQSDAPALTWVNLFQLTNLGGVIVHRHNNLGDPSAQSDGNLRYSVRHGKEGDGSLWLDDRNRRSTPLSQGVDVECLGHREIAMEPNPTFEAAYRKRGRTISDPQILGDVVLELRNSVERDV